MRVENHRIANAVKRLRLMSCPEQKIQQIHSFSHAIIVDCCVSKKKKNCIKTFSFIFGLSSFVLCLLSFLQRIKLIYENLCNTNTMERNVASMLTMGL